jgi:sulfur carrier protein
MAKITVNGKAQALENPTTLAQLIALNNITQPDMVSVQLNEEFVNQTDFESIELKDGDEVDFLYFMGGGQVV